MRKFKMRLQAVVLTVAMVVGFVFGNGQIHATAADTDQTVNVKIQLTYGQTEARGMLDAVNEFRQGEDAWVWNESDTEKITYSNLGTLRIDPVLEQVAMLRAAETAISYAHTRPNGQSCFTAYSADIKGAVAENIAVGYSSAEAVFKAWQETDENYSGQGHRRNMLGSGYVSIGIGHVTYQGTQYWVQEFSSKSTGESLAEVNDSTAVVELEVLKSNIQSVVLNQTEYSLTAGESVSLDDLKIVAKITGYWSYNYNVCILENDYTITADNDQIVSIEDGKLIAKSAGSTTLTVSALGQEMQLPVTVTGESDTPTKTPDPSASEQPNVTKAPSATKEPTETQKPDGTDAPGTQKPDATGVPTETQKPDATNVPKVTQNPNEVKRPDSGVTVESDKEVSVKTGNPLKGKKVSGIKVKQKKKIKKLTISYKRMKKADGYQITYAWNKKFTKHCKVKSTKSASLTLSGLKHKKVYYFKVCAYTLDQNGKKLYSADSKILKYKMK